jgi:hypothetical protein
MPSLREGSVSGSDRLKNRKTDPDVYHNVADTQRYPIKIFHSFLFSKLIFYIEFGFENLLLIVVHAVPKALIAKQYIGITHWALCIQEGTEYR